MRTVTAVLPNLGPVCLDGTKSLLSREAQVRVAVAGAGLWPDIAWFRAEGQWPHDSLRTGGALFSALFHSIFTPSLGGLK